MKSSETGLIEDITSHQMWQLSQTFYFATKSAKPTKRMLMILQDIFPCVDAKQLTIVSNISVNGGKAMHGDVVAFFQNNEMHVGELLVSVGVNNTAQTFSFIAKWQQVKLDVSWLSCVVSDDDVCKIPTNCLDSVLVYHMSSDRKECAVHLPCELRPRA